MRAMSRDAPETPPSPAPLAGLPPPGAERAARREWIPGLALFLVALAVRIPGASGDLWIDEIATVINSIRFPLGHIATTFVSANQHILYSLLGRVSISLFGETEFTLRLPAILFGAASAPALYVLARSVVSRTEALAAAGLLAVSYHHAYFSQNARGYTGYLFLSILSTAFLFRALARDARGAWAGFALASAANVYMHLNGLFLLASQLAAAALLYGKHAIRTPEGRALARRAALAACGAGILIAALYAPIVPSMLRFFATESRDVGWLPSPALIRVILRDAAPGPLGLAAALATAAVAAAGIVSLARSAPLFVLVAFLPIAAGLASVLAMGVGTYPRFFLLLLPFGIVIATRGLRVTAEILARAGASRGTARARTAGAALFAALVLLAAAGAAARLPRLYTLPKQDYGAALDLVRRSKAAEDLIAGAYIADLGAQFYEPEALSARTAADLEAILARGRTVWLLVTLEQDMRQRAPDLAAIVDSRFREVRRYPGLVGDGAVSVWRTVD
jgi:hypothetical protein